MIEEKVRNKIFDIYYGESSKTLDDVSSEESVSLKDCQDEWQRLEKISTLFQSLPQDEPSAVVIQRIRALSKDSSSLGFFERFSLQAKALAGGFLALLFVVTFFQVQSESPVSSDDLTKPLVASSESVAPLTDSNVSQPIEYYRLPTNNRPITLRRNSPVKTVSFGNVQNRLPVDTALDHKILTRAVMDSSELEALYFRARKLQQMGYYQQALRDYNFIARFYPKSNHIKSVLLSAASCYEALTQNDEAISILEAYEKHFGASEDVELWIDELKSETF